MTPEMPTSAFERDNDIQIQPILQISGGEEVATSGFGNSRLSPKSDNHTRQIERRISLRCSWIGFRPDLRMSRMLRSSSEPERNCRAALCRVN
jgi:hypothetical protein